MPAPHPLYLAAVDDQMARYDAEYESEWRADLERNGCTVMGLFTDTTEEPRTSRLILTPAWGNHLPADVWATWGVERILQMITEMVGKLRGSGDESLTPAYEQARLIGLGLVFQACHVDTGEEVYGFIMSDITNNHFGRWRMGTPDAVNRFYHHDPTLCTYTDAIEAGRIRAEHVNLSALLWASLSTPRQCREKFGPNDVEECLNDIDGLLRLFADQLPPDHPLSSVRLN